MGNSSHYLNLRKLSADDFLSLQENNVLLDTFIVILSNITVTILVEVAQNVKSLSHISPLAVLADHKLKSRLKIAVHVRTYQSYIHCRIQPQH